MSQTERFVVKKESGSEWARVIDTATGMQIARYNVMPRKRSLRDGWEDAKKHAKRLNAVSVSSSLLLDREEAGGQISVAPRLTDEEIDAIMDAQWGKGLQLSQYQAHRCASRAIERAVLAKLSPVRLCCPRCGASGLSELTGSELGDCPACGEALQLAAGVALPDGGQTV